MLFVYSTVLVGIPVFVYCLATVLASASYHWFLLAFLIALAGVFPVRIPSIGGRLQSITLTVSDLFIFIGILLFSPEVAVVLAVIDGLVAIVRAMKTVQLKRILFNVSQVGLSAFLAGHLFYFLQGTNPPLTEAAVTSNFYFFIRLGLCASIHFFLNSLMVALAVKLARRRTIWEVWKEHLPSASLTSVAGAIAAGFVFLNLDSAPALASGMLIPILLITYYAFRMNQNRVTEAQEHVEQVDILYHSTIASLAMAIDAKDQNTHGHVRRVQSLVLGLARRAGVEDELQLKALRAAALLHDIGKLAIPEHILNKPGRLSPAEMEKMKLHPAIGAEILETVPFPYPVVPFVRHHHERWDGSGYPDGLSGNEIPLGSRILAIIDCYDALRSNRPYRAKLARNEALEIIASESGKAYDPHLVSVFEQNLDELEEEIERLSLDKSPPSLDKLRTPKMTSTRRLEDMMFFHAAAGYEEFQAVYGFGQGLKGSVKVKEAMEILATKISDFIPYDTCAVYLRTSTGDRLEMHHATGKESRELSGLTFSMGKGVSGWVAANNKPVYDMSTEVEFLGHSKLQSRFGSCLSAPLTANGQVLGVITLYSAADVVYTRNDLRLLEMLAPLCTGTINNAVLFERAHAGEMTDDLTGLPNLHYLQSCLSELINSREPSSSSTFSIMMIDIDDFGRINDSLGEDQADEVLRIASGTIRQLLRSNDALVRFGGDEFVAILFNTDLKTATRVAERIKNGVGDTPIRTPENRQIRLEVSVGVATFPDQGATSERLLISADRAMNQDRLNKPQKRFRWFGTHS